MPHDRQGNTLKEGDIVMLPVKVKSLAVGEDYCNVTVETLHPMFPGDRHDAFTLNTRQLEPAPK